MGRRLNFGYFLAEGARSIVSHGLMSFAAVCMIVACLVIMGSFTLVAVNADVMLGQLESENEFLAYIEEYYTDEQIAQLEEQIRAIPNVSSVRFVSKEEAKAIFLQGREDEGLYASLPDSVLRDRFSIHVTDLNAFQQTVDAVKALPGVANYRAETEIADAFVTIRNVASALATILIAILVVISLFIIANTIRLATFTRREEIAIMKMCGATNWFVRWPFIVEGLLLGLLGAVLAFFAQWGIYAAIYNAIEESGAMTLFPVLSFKSMALRVLGAFSAAGAVIGGCGSVVAIRRFLKV